VGHSPAENSRPTRDIAECTHVVSLGLLFVRADLMSTFVREMSQKVRA
jgi:hypothetical protein